MEVKGEGEDRLAHEHHVFLGFDEVQTAKLRLEMDGDGEFSTGVLEWRVLDSGKSPDFPPIVAAGVDRMVIVGGKTYLTGTLQSLSGTPTGPTRRNALMTWLLPFAVIVGGSVVFNILADAAARRHALVPRHQRNPFPARPGGRGGGRPNMAQGSLPDASKVNDALSKVTKVVEEKLN